MGIGIPSHILGLKGQRVNKMKLDEEAQQLVIHCSRDRRRNAIDSVTGKQVATGNRIHSAERLVHQQQMRMNRQCSGDADALHLTAR